MRYLSRFAAVQAIFLLPCCVRGGAHVRRRRGSTVSNGVEDNNDRTSPSSLRVIRRNQRGIPVAIVGDDLGHIGFHVRELLVDDGNHARKHHNAVHENVKRSLSRIMSGPEFVHAATAVETSFNNNTETTLQSLENLTRSDDIHHKKNQHDFVARTSKPLISKDGCAHVRFQQIINGYPVEGGLVMVHTDPTGKIVAANGEFITLQTHLHNNNHDDLFTQPSINASTALDIAMDQAEILHVHNKSEPELTVVVDSNTGEACFAWKSVVEHTVEVVVVDMVDEDTTPQPQASSSSSSSSIRTTFRRDLVYANAHDGHLCALHPQIFGLTEGRGGGGGGGGREGQYHSKDPIIRTLACEPLIPARPKYNERHCALYSDSTTPIDPHPQDDENVLSFLLGNVDLDYSNDEMLDHASSISHHHNPEALYKAHNFALATYRYYWNNHGLWSMNGQGMPVISFVLNSEFEFDSAYWNGASVTFGAGVEQYHALSLGADIVAHEFTHGVTQFSSGLIYTGESGALNEAMSDIFGALVDRQEGATGKNIWYIGEHTARKGGFIRDMANPASKRHFDYYPTRYQGKANRGGVHWNSGIVNLAFKLLVTGGTHPRIKSSVPVRGLIDIFGGDEDEAFQTAADIFFCANQECLTPRSTFEDARFCTTIICGMTGRPQDEQIVHSVNTAWHAVGVGGPASTTSSSASGIQAINSLPDESPPEQDVKMEELILSPAPSDPTFGPPSLGPLSSIPTEAPTAFVPFTSNPTGLRQTALEPTFAPTATSSDPTLSSSRPAPSSFRGGEVQMTLTTSTPSVSVFTASPSAGLPSREPSSFPQGQV